MRYRERTRYNWAFPVGCSCMNCRHRDMQFCPFHEGYTGWDDVYCNKWEEVQSSASTVRDE